jgi:hypothetical protein
MLESGSIEMLIKVVTIHKPNISNKTGLLVYFKN